MSYFNVKYSITPKVGKHALTFHLLPRVTIYRNEPPGRNARNNLFILQNPHLCMGRPLLLFIVIYQVVAIV